MKYPVQAYILVRTANLSFMYFTGVDHEIYTKCKQKTSSLIKGISNHHISSGIKSQPVKKTLCYSVPKTFDFAQNSSFPFHHVPFRHNLITCVLLTDKPNKSCQNSKKLERNVISATKKKSFQNEKEIVLHQKRQILPFHKLLQKT